MPCRRIAPCALLAFAACSDSGATPIDAAAIDAPADAPVDAAIDGPPLIRHTFVVSRMTWPTTAGEALSLGLDVDQLLGDGTGGIDNELGAFLGSLRSIAPAIDVDASNARAVNQGDAITLVELFAADLTASASATAALHVGADPQPPACEGAADLVCRHHLDGTATIARAAGVPAGTPMPGAIVGARLTGGPGTFTLRAAIGATLVTVPMTATRVEWGTTTSGLATGKLGGAIARTDFDAVVVPALATWATALVDADCPAPRSPPSCSCPAGSAGASLMTVLDANQDCTVAAAEVRASVTGILANDLDLDQDGTAEAVSLGVGVEAVAATFP